MKMLNAFLKTITGLFQAFRDEFRQRALVVLTSAILGLVMVTVFLLSAATVQDVASAPLAAPTPVTIADSPSGSVSYPLYLCRDQVLTADTRCDALKLPTYNRMDLQWWVDMGDTVNTTTLKLQHSIDGIHWSDGGTLASVVTDTTGFNQFYNFGVYTAIYADVANTGTLTVTIVGLGK